MELKTKQELVNALTQGYYEIQHLRRQLEVLQARDDVVRTFRAMLFGPQTPITNSLCRADPLMRFAEELQEEITEQEKLSVDSRDSA